MRENCVECNVTDDENHRLNHCRKFRDVNLSNHTRKVDFQKIHSNDRTEINEILNEIGNVWNLRNANGTMYI